MKNIISILLLIPIALFIGCKSGELTPEQKQKYDAAMQAPLEFTVNKADIEIMWGKAEVLITDLSDMKLQIISDHVLETYNPHELGQTGFRVTKTPIDNDNFQIAITGLFYSGNPFGIRSEKKQADQMAHILSYRLQQQLIKNEDVNSNK